MKEYKVISVKKDKEYELAEEKMNEMAQEGWEVVNIQQDSLGSLTTQLIITFCRNNNQ